ncbi:hypothetical protein SSP531S_34930 [Streptomyces spongiicola]|uniref:Uncharacterized protein n=1 Tax=Streptomyces spongiicola TaxID=1690221 RepID=A0A388T1N1_9ACTN|nr:hypothetical protein SSP531S_34930 [Streptomyces spongiicola]
MRSCGARALGEGRPAKPGQAERRQADWRQAERRQADWRQAADMPGAPPAPARCGARGREGRGPTCSRVTSGRLMTVRGHTAVVMDHTLTLEL